MLRAPPPGSLFRPSLPPPAVELSSAEGIALFKRALEAGTCAPFFRLIEQLHTQSEPAFCGLASLVTVLNAVGVDPRRTWKGPWRFYSEELLDCCVDLDTVKTKGIDIAQLVCTGRCNGLEMTLHRAGASSENLFRSALEEAMRSDDRFVIACYSRAELGQSGDGHFSPLGGYDAESDRVLVLDTARFKYRPHWVSVRDMWRALDTSEKTSSGRASKRGFVVAKAANTLALPPSSRFFVIGLADSSSSSLSDVKRIIENDLHSIITKNGTPEQNLLAACALLERVIRPPNHLPLDEKDSMVMAIKSTEIFSLLRPNMDDDARSVWWSFVLLCLDDSFWKLPGLPPRPVLSESLESALSATHGRLEQLISGDTCAMCDSLTDACSS